MSSAQILWDNWSKYDDLDSVKRSGFFKIRAYGFGKEAKIMMKKYHTESVLIHSGRTAMLFSDMMDLYPAYFKDIDKYTALKIALNHDVGELKVGDVCDDGRIEHETKKDPEWSSIVEHYSHFPEETYIKSKNMHRQFEEANTFLGQSIKMADKLDFIAKLIKMQSQGYYLNNEKYYSQSDWRLADEIESYEFIDIVANHLRHLMMRYHYDQRLAMIATQFLSCGLKTIDRPFFEWWPIRQLY